MNTALGINAFIARSKFSALRAGALINENENLSQGSGGLGLNFLNEGVEDAIGFRLRSVLGVPQNT
jgi:hypothetical protein